MLCPIQEVGHTGLEARCNGVESVMAEEGIPVVRFTIDYNVSGSAGLIGDAFAANPDFNAIVTLGPGPAESYYQYASENGVTPETGCSRDIRHQPGDLRRHPGWHHPAVH